MKKYYLIEGIVKVTGWYGQNLWGRIEKKITEEEFEELKRDNFLIDYLDFGVKSVDFIDLRITLIEIESNKNGDVIKKYLHSQSWYETHGKLSEEEEKELEKIYFDLEVVVL